MQTQLSTILVDCRYYLDIATLFRGSLKHKRGILGIVSHFRLSTTITYLLGYTHLYSIAAYVKMRTCETCGLILVGY